MDIVLHLLRINKKTVKKSIIWVKFFIIDCVFYRVWDWDDLQTDLHVSLIVGFKVQFSCIVPVFLEFNVSILVVTVRHLTMFLKFLTHAHVTGREQTRNGYLFTLQNLSEPS